MKEDLIDKMRTGENDIFQNDGADDVCLLIFLFNLQANRTRIIRFPPRFESAMGMEDVALKFTEGISFCNAFA